MSTVGALVIGVTGGLLFSFAYWWWRWQQKTQALRWWYARQSNDLNVQSEYVRERVFQKAFALKRALEIGALSPSEEATQQFETCLTLANAFNQDLERVSDQLAAPFLAESLPLALQTMLRRWAEDTRLCSPELSLSLPTDWPHQPMDKQRLVLQCVCELLRTYQSELAGTSLQKVELALIQSKESAKLQLAVYSQATQLSEHSMRLVELNYIKCVFQTLMPGSCQVTVKSSEDGVTLSGEFDWSLR